MKANIEKAKNDHYLSPIEKAQLPSTGYPEVIAGYEYSPGLRDFLDILIRHRRSILLSLICIVIPTVAYIFMVNPTYQARGSLELSPYATKVTKFQDMADPQKTDQFTVTQVELLQSPALARRVATALHLDEHPLFATPKDEGQEPTGPLAAVSNAVSGFKRQMVLQIKTWLKTEQKQEEPHGANFDELRQQKSLESYITSNLSVMPKGDTNIVSIAFDSEDPALAKSVVNSLIDQFILWQMDRKVDSTKAARQQLDKQIELARNRLESTETELNDYSKDVGIVSLDSKMNLVYQQLEQINSALANIEADRIKKEESYKLASSGDLNTSPLIQQNDLIQKLRNQYLDSLAEYEKLKVKYKDGHPTMKSVSAQMREVGAKINSEQERILRVVKNDYLSTLTAEKKLEETAQEKKAMALKLNDLASHYKILEREVEVNKQIYQSLLERSKEIDANVATDLTNIKVVDYASLPLIPYKPNVSRSLLIAVMAGIVFGIGLAFVREHLDDSIKRIDELPMRYWIPLLGVVPLATKKERKELHSLVRLKPASAFAEAIRIIKLSIQQANHSKPMKSILITSTVKGEGKSTLALNLAQSFALSDERVLLVGADIRRPSLHRYLEHDESSRGLSDYLSGACKYEEILKKTGIENLHYIPAGVLSSNPTDLLTSRRMKDLMEVVFDHFDRVILDAPPLTSDILALGNQVNGIVLITTLGQTQREAVKVFRRDVGLTKAHLLGSIVNKFSANRFNAGAFYNTYYNCYEASYGCTTGSDLQAQTGRAGG